MHRKGVQNTLITDAETQPRLVQGSFHGVTFAPLHKNKSRTVGLRGFVALSRILEKSPQSQTLIVPDNTLA